MIDRPFSINSDDSEHDIATTALKLGNKLGLEGIAIDKIEGPFVGEKNKRVYLLKTRIEGP